jgi:hypothetical protein
LDHMHHKICDECDLILHNCDECDLWHMWPYIALLILIE